MADEAPPLEDNEIAISHEEAVFLDLLMNSANTMYGMGLNARQIQRALLVAAHQYTYHMVCACERCVEKYGTLEAPMTDILCRDKSLKICIDDKEAGKPVTDNRNMN